MVKNRVLENLFKELRMAGIHLWVEQGKLRSKAPKGAMTPALRAEITAHRDALIAFLAQAEQGMAQQTITPVPRTDKMPLSFAQQRLWFLDQLGSNTTYNMPFVLNLSGRLNVAALQRALHEIIQRHESLRTTYAADKGTPYQVIHSKRMIALTQIDLSGLDSEQQDSEIKRLTIAEAAQPFDLSCDLMLRTTLLHLDRPSSILYSQRPTPNRYILFLTMHHIASDGWSIGVLVQELATLYEAFCQGQPSSLPELSIQYADFATWQRNHLQGELLQAQLTYWKEQLVGVPELISLPADRPRPPQQSFRGGMVPFRLDTTLTQKLYLLSQQQGTTLYMTLLAAFQIFIARYSGQTDVVIGSPIANRNHQEIEQLIGFFVNTLVIRTDLSILSTQDGVQPSFLDILSQVKKTTQAAYDHQDIPFERLVEELCPERHTNYNPLVQIMFALQNAPMGAFHLSGLDITLNEPEEPTTPFDLELHFSEEENSLQGYWLYSIDLFEQATVERMVGHFQTLIEGIVENPTQSIAMLPLLQEDERHQLLFERNDTTMNYPKDKCVHQLFEEQVVRTPNAIALIYCPESLGEDSATLPLRTTATLSYRELNERANQLAHYLQSLGVGPEVLVGVYLEYSLEAIIGLLAILKAGGVYLPLNPEYPPERLAAILEETEAPLLITQSTLLSKLPSHPKQTLLLDQDATQIARESCINPVNLVEPENLVYVVYTSGSTGKPKGIMIEHSGLVNHCYAIVDAYQLTEHDRVLQVNPLSFDVCMEELFPSWLAGATVVMRPEWPCAVSDLAHFIEQEALTLLNLTVGYWHEWVVQLDDVTVPQSVRMVIVGNDKALQERLALWQQKVGDRVTWRNAYGTSEATVSTTLYDPLDSHRGETDAVPIGRPLANTQIYLLDAYRQPVPIGVAGEIYIGGAGVGRGYWQQPQLTAERFIANPFVAGYLYRTGDSGRFLPDGNLEFLGRIDNQVKIRGFRVEPSEVEAALNQHALIQQCAVIPYEDASNNTCLVAYVATQTPLELKKLRTFVQERLPGYMTPAAFVQMASLPLSVHGKVDRRALPAPDTNNFVNTNDVPPATDTEVALAIIWCQLLGAKQAGRHDDFFDLGGHSLLIMQLFYQIEKTFGIQLPIQNLIQFSTLMACAEQIDLQVQNAAYEIKTADEFKSKDEWLAEMELDPTIHPPNPYTFMNANEIQGVFLTGATGFLGAFLLVELLQKSQATVYCLVRADDAQQAANRIQETLKQYQLWQDSFTDRIVPVVGDLAQPRLGLSFQEFQKLAETVDLIYHNGASVNFVYPYETLKPANVLGTVEILRLAGLVKTKPIHYISTISVFPPWVTLCEENNPLEFELYRKDDLKLKHGYTTSKWVAERLLLKAYKRGFPICIYRPSEITGDSRTGIANMKDAFHREIQSCFQLGITPDRHDYQENLVPVDYASQAIVHLSLRSESIGEIFHITNPSSNSKNDFFDYAVHRNYQLQKLPQEEWRKKAVARAKADPSIAIYPLLSYYMISWVNLSTLISKRLAYDCHNTLAGLADSNIVCPPVNSLLMQTYFDYFMSLPDFPKPMSFVNNYMNL